MNPTPPADLAETTAVLLRLVAAVTQRTGDPAYAKALSLDVYTASVPPGCREQTPGFARLLAIALKAARSSIKAMDATVARQCSDAGVIASLPRPDREILRMVYWDRLSMAELAECLGCSITQAGRRLDHAYRRAERRLDAWPDSSSSPAK